MNYLRTVATDAFRACATRLMNLTARASSSYSAPAHTILSDTVFIKAQNSIELEIPLRSENAYGAGKLREFRRLGQK